MRRYTMLAQTIRMDIERIKGDELYNLDKNLCQLIAELEKSLEEDKDRPLDDDRPIKSMASKETMALIKEINDYTTEVHELCFFNPTY